MKFGSFHEIDMMLNRNLFPSSNIVSISPDYMVKKDGSIVCISSICGIENVGASPGYQLSKAALNMYVKSIAKYLNNYKIRINTLSLLETSCLKDLFGRKKLKKSDEVLDMLKNQVILNRFGTPQEITNFVVFLLSSYSSFSTGTTFVVDGGQTKGI